jgi:hypothetical protein
MLEKSKKKSLTERTKVTESIDSFLRVLSALCKKAQPLSSLNLPILLFISNSLLRFKYQFS